MSNVKPPRPYFPSDVNDLPERDYLPDLFEFFDGARVETREDWLRRREELSDLMQYYLFGHKHETQTDASRLRFLSEEEREELTRPPIFPGFPAIRPEAVVEVTHLGVTAQILIDEIKVPRLGVSSGFSAPYPAVIVVGGLAKEQSDVLVENGYAYVAMNTGSVYSDGGNNPRTGAYCQLYPYVEGDYELDSGVLMGWAWGVSRIIDAFQNDPTLGVNWRQCAVTGCSRNGKAAALAGAFDERIAVTAPSDPGGGGLTGFRYSTEGQLHAYEDVPAGHDTVYSRNESAQRAIGNPSESAWFCSNARMFLHANAARCPFDLHAVAALVAPRPFICWTGEAQQSWLNSPGTALDVLAAREVYAFLGSDDCAVVVRDGPHANQGRDLPDLIAIMDKAFGRRNNLEIRVFDGLLNDSGGSYDNSGAFRAAGVYDSIADFTRIPYHLENSFIRWAKPGKHTIWSYNTFVTVGVASNLVFYSDAPYVELLGERIPVVNGFASRALTAANAGRIKVTALGGDMEPNSIEIVALTMETALRYGLNLTGGSPDGMAIGFTSPVTGNPEASIGGRLLTTSSYDDGSGEVYLERYGISLKSHAFPAEDSFTFTVRGFGLEALPGYIFDITVNLHKTKIKNWFGQEVDAIAADFGEAPQILTETQYRSLK